MGRTIKENQQRARVCVCFFLPMTAAVCSRSPCSVTTTPFPAQTRHWWAAHGESSEPHPLPLSVPAKKVLCSYEPSPSQSKLIMVGQVGGEGIHTNPACHPGVSCNTLLSPPFLTTYKDLSSPFPPFVTTATYYPPPPPPPKTTTPTPPTPQELSIFSNATSSRCRRQANGKNVNVLWAFTALPRAGNLLVICRVEKIRARTQSSSWVRRTSPYRGTLKYERDC